MTETQISKTARDKRAEAKNVLKKILLGSLVIAFTGFAAFILLFILMFLI